MTAGATFPAAGCGKQRRRPNRADRLAGFARVARHRDLALVLRLQEIGPILWDVRHHLLVDLEGHHAVVIAVPEAVGVFERSRDAVPGRDFVGLQQRILF